MYIDGLQTKMLSGKKKTRYRIILQYETICVTKTSKLNMHNFIYIYVNIDICIYIPVCVCTSDVHINNYMEKSTGNTGAVSD